MENRNRENTSIYTIPHRFCRDLEYFFTDIDDTITRCGLLPASSMKALWDLYEAGIKVVPITGRPAGWCDHIARMWPVDGVIGENGAFYYTFDRIRRRVERIYCLSEEERRKSRRKLERIRRRVLDEVPGCAIASDQDFRLFDLAIDFCEDVPPLSREEMERIIGIIEEEKAVYKISSIHINCWYGFYNKVSCLRKFLMDRRGMSIEELQEKIFFTGDSPNDEPIFSEMKYTGAVANINNFLGTMTARPSYIASGESSEGFEEIVQALLTIRKTSPLL